MRVRIAIQAEPHTLNKLERTSDSDANARERPPLFYQLPYRLKANSFQFLQGIWPQHLMANTLSEDLEISALLIETGVEWTNPADHLSFLASSLLQRELD